MVDKLQLVTRVAVNLVRQVGYHTKDKMKAMIGTAIGVLMD